MDNATTARASRLSTQSRRSRMVASLDGETVRTLPRRRVRGVHHQVGLAHAQRRCCVVPVQRALRRVGRGTAGPGEVGAAAGFLPPASVRLMLESEPSRDHWRAAFRKPDGDTPWLPWFPAGSCTNPPRDTVSPLTRMTCRAVSGMPGTGCTPAVCGIFLKSRIATSLPDRSYGRACV